MPEICRFLGIIISMYYKEHGPPHFHAKYGEQRATFSIKELKLIEGSLPKRVVSLVLEWAFEHRDELMKDWKLAEKHEDLNKYRAFSLGGSNMHWITELSYIDSYKLKLKFENNEYKLVDLQPHLDGKIFEPLKDISYFKTVTLNEDIDTIVWQNNADFSPDFLYGIGQSIK